MSAPPQAKGAPITDKAQLIEWFAAGSKPREDWRIGTEHEKFVFTRDDLKPAPYEGERSIRAVLEGLAARFGWTPVEEEGRPIALTKAGCSITLEPGGQFELSGAPLRTLHETCSEVNRHLAEVKEVCDPIGVGMLGLGFAPTWSRAEMPWMPKGRYAIMKRYMPTRGSLGLDMMLRTCTVQTNLDFLDEADMVRKFRVSLALQPIATALFANSPFTEGKVNGFKSFRSQVWTDTDPDRCGILPFVFEEGFGFERWVDYLLDVPMYFVYRDGTYLDAAGLSFRDFMAGKLEILPGELPLMSDWSDHVTTVFPEVRLKKYLEMRGADGGPWRRLCALPALWVGLLYDDEALDAAEALVADWTAADHEHLRAEVPRLALDTRFRGRPLTALAGEVLDIAALGLKHRGQLNGEGMDERLFLDVLREIVASGRSPADALLEDFAGPLGGDMAKLFEAYQY
ncbi:glutamate--cysteine ligase [Aquibaculum arenosum]|uniref:Glutamate--cysteine ligase n=1 Tax=Aquibaculum arenosum TaxID=3032591 RepID=A0ABT5YM19_9PROT|nr:glutamate--cysteine ligase [Fodinicurvata sp. CAU 1616]MDF2095974.1 glutamate--cysteine ligase [Fodinicurvata sp. CAU 1616]